MAIARRHNEAAAAAAMHKSSVESFYSFDESEHQPDFTSVQAKHPARQVRPSPLHLETGVTYGHASPTHRRYQSDEEIPSPSMEEDYSEGHNSSSEEVTIDASIDLDHIEPLSPALPIEEARSIRIVFTGKPSLIHVGRIAPMQPRRRPAIAPANSYSSASPQPPVPIPRRSSRRRNNRSISLYEPPVAVAADAQPRALTTTSQTPVHIEPTAAHITAHPSANGSNAYLSSLSTVSSRNSSVTNFSAPLRHPARPRAIPQYSSSGASTATSGSSNVSTSSSPPPQLSRGPASPAETETTEPDDDDDELAEALLRESAEIQVRTASLERERQFALAGEMEVGYYEDQDMMDEYHVEQGVPGYHVKHSSMADLDNDDDAASMDYGSYYADRESLDAPTPTTYDAYDPYGIAPPSLESRGRRGSAAAVASAARKGWKGLARAGRRRGAIAG